MAEYMIQGESLTAVANAIRERSGTNEPLVFPEGFKSAIEEIPDYGEQMIFGNITEYYHPTITKMRTYAFAYCQSLTKAVFPELIESGYVSFQHTEAMKEFVAPKLEKVTALGLACSGFSVADFPRLHTIESEGFNFTPIKILTLRNTDAMVLLKNANGLANTPIAKGTGYIYAPRKFLSDTDAASDYRQATNWSTYASQFRALEDYTVDGTTAGELDESKI